MGLPGLGFRVEGSRKELGAGFRVEGLGFRVDPSTLRGLDEGWEG